MGMDQLHDIAIVAPNTLAAMGLSALLEEILPGVVVRSFPSFQALIDDTPDMYAHYFVAWNIYFEHTAFFLKRRYQAIVLCEGEKPSLQGIPHIDICQPQTALVKGLMKLQRHGHEMTHQRVAEAVTDDDLSPREIEVIRLVSMGLINKQIADRLNIGITTVISHRKNITEKLGIKSVAALAVYSIMHGYIDIDQV